jgi:hypothetical protein
MLCHGRTMAQVHSLVGPGALLHCALTTCTHLVRSRPSCKYKWTLHCAPTRYNHNTSYHLQCIPMAHGTTVPLWCIPVHYSTKPLYHAPTTHPSGWSDHITSPLSGAHIYTALLSSILPLGYHITHMLVHTCALLRCALSLMAFILLVRPNSLVHKHTFHHSTVMS